MSDCVCPEIDLQCCPPDDYDYTAEPLVLWQFGDYGVNTLYPGPPWQPQEEGVEALVNADNAALIVTSGDNDYVGNYNESQAPFVPWIERQRMWPVPGNHDWDFNNLTDYLAYFTYLNSRRYYNRRFGPVEIFFMDSGINSAGTMVEPDGNTAGTLDSDGNPVGGSDQWRWFVERVNASTAPWKFAVAHHPDLTSGTNHGPYPVMEWLWSDLGIDIRFAGHEHSYERLIQGNTTHIVNGSGGQTLSGFGATSPYSQFRYNGLQGALRLAITPEKVSGKFVNINGTTLETFTLTK